MREVPHRIKNDLGLVGSFLYLQSDASEEPETRESLDKARKRIEVLHVVYQSLYQADEPGRVSLRDLVAAVAQAAQSGTLPGARIESDVADLNVPGKVAINIGLMVNELVTNALKYGESAAGSSVISVTLNEDTYSSDTSSIALVVADNGLGFPERLLERPETDGFGLTLVDALASQHGGSIDVGNTGPDGGARVEVKLP